MGDASTVFVHPLVVRVGALLDGRTLQEVFEENADLVAVAKRVSDGARFPDYFQVARDLPGETELLVHEEAVRFVGRERLGSCARAEGVRKYKHFNLPRSAGTTTVPKVSS